MYKVLFHFKILELLTLFAKFFKGLHFEKYDSNWMILILRFTRSKMYQTAKKVEIESSVTQFKTFKREDLCRTAK